MLAVSLWKLCVNKLKILDWGKPEYYKSTGESTKSDPPNFEISVVQAKDGGTWFLTQI